jgi:hypothetical protein
LQNALISESLFKQANAMYRDLLAKGADSETAAAQVQRALADHLGMTHQKINDRKE